MKPRTDHPFRVASVVLTGTKPANFGQGLIPTSVPVSDRYGFSFLIGPSFSSPIVFADGLLLLRSSSPASSSFLRLLSFSSVVVFHRLCSATTKTPLLSSSIKPRRMHLDLLRANTSSAIPPFNSAPPFSVDSRSQDSTSSPETSAQKRRLRSAGNHLRRSSSGNPRVLTRLQSPRPGCDPIQTRKQTRVLLHDPARLLSKPILNSGHFSPLIRSRHVTDLTKTEPEIGSKPV